MKPLYKVEENNVYQYQPLSGESGLGHGILYGKDAWWRLIATFQNFNGLTGRGHAILYKAQLETLATLAEQKGSPAGPRRIRDEK